MRYLQQFLRDDEGATMVEYGLMVALIAVVCIGTVAYIGQALDYQFWHVADTVNHSDTVTPVTANPGQP